MTIKDAEARTGLARANIRYYEDQGFFTAARGENGYRDYSGQDVEILLKVKLLRQLGFSLEEIRDFQRGDQTLEAALLRREEGLDRERQELDQAAELCRTLREDGADFATLDARRYLDRLDQGERPAALEEDRSPRSWLTFRRYGGRMLDYLVWFTLTNLCFMVGRRWGLSLPDHSFWMPIIPMGLAEALLLHRTGTTWGKRLMCLRLLREDGCFLSLGEAARRALVVNLVLAVYILASIGTFGEQFKGWVRAASILAMGATWRFGDEVGEQIEYWFFPWQRDGQVYLDTSTGEEPLSHRKEIQRGLFGTLLTLGICYGIIYFLLIRSDFLM